MLKTIAFLSLSVFACGPFPPLGETTGQESASEAVVTGAGFSDTGLSSGGMEPENPIDEPCECDPKNPICGPGLQCVPRGNNQFSCMAKCSGQNSQGGGYITTCPETCFYPFFSDKGTGDAYCPACIACGPVNPLALVCQ